jgi:hypothetical protein
MLKQSIILYRPCSSNSELRLSSTGGLPARVTTSPCYMRCLLQLDLTSDRTIPLSRQSTQEKKVRAISRDQGSDHWPGSTKPATLRPHTNSAPTTSTANLEGRAQGASANPLPHRSDFGGALPRNGLRLQPTNRPWRPADQEQLTLPLASQRSGQMTAGTVANQTASVAAGYSKQRVMPDENNAPAVACAVVQNRDAEAKNRDMPKGHTSAAATSSRAKQPLSTAAVSSNSMWSAFNGDSSDDYQSP